MDYLIKWLLFKEISDFEQSCTYLKSSVSCKNIYYATVRNLKVCSDSGKKEEFLKRWQHFSKMYQRKISYANCQAEFRLRQSYIVKDRIGLRAIGIVTDLTEKSITFRYPGWTRSIDDTFNRKDFFDTRMCLPHEMTDYRIVYSKGRYSKCQSCNDCGRFHTNLLCEFGEDVVICEPDDVLMSVIVQVSVVRRQGVDENVFDDEDSLNTRFMMVGRSIKNP